MKEIILFIFLIHTVMSLGQPTIPILEATKNTLSIKEGNIFHQNIWTVSPNIEWDEFVTNKFKNQNTITFYSDIDSISFNVKPNQTYDFIVQLNKKTLAYTRINTSIQKTPSILIEKVLVYHKKNATKQTVTDSIPFEIGKDNRIHIIGKVNQSDSLDFIFDTGANAIVIAKNLIKNIVTINLDGHARNKGSDGISTIATSSNNQLEIGNLIWNEVNLLAIDYHEPHFDVVLGWIAFEEKIVEINYEKKTLVIHPNIETLPLEGGYEKYTMKMIQGIPYIEASCIANDKKATGWLSFDTGSSSSILLSQEFAQKRNFNDVMFPIGTSYYSGSAGFSYAANDYVLPKFELGNFETYLIPISINQKDPEGISNNDLIGNLLLKRFNAILDFKNHIIYLKPNKLLHSPYY